jgi:hypothetical protein
MIVNNASDLKIIAVIDWEWAYTAPYQMFSSAPRWLLIKPPISWDEPNGLQCQQYQSCLDLFLSELECEERKRTRPRLEHNDRLSSLMRNSISNGQFWFHELIYDCFTSADNPAWKAICEIQPDILLAPQPPGLDAFVETKMKQLAAYIKEWKLIKGN